MHFWHTRDVAEGEPAPGDVPQTEGQLDLFGGGTNDQIAPGQ